MNEMNIYRFHLLFSGLRMDHLSPSAGMHGAGGNSPGYTPRGATPLLAAQIDQVRIGAAESNRVSEIDGVTPV